MTPFPRISVVMGTYNSAPYLEATVASILGQTYTDFEFIIIDDASTDATWSLLEQLAAEDARIVLQRNATNLGISATRNRGTELARGEYSAVMDHDDISLPERLGQQVAYLDRRPDVGVVGGVISYLVGGRVTTPTTVHYPLTPPMITWTLCFESPLSHPASMIRRSLLIEVGGYCADYVTANDYDLWQRLSRMTRLANLPDVLLQYRWHNDNASLHRIADTNREVPLIAQRAVEAIYGRPVPLDAVKQILRYHGTPIQEMGAVAQMIDALALRYRAGAKLTQTDWASIRSDAARRILWLMQHRAETGSMTALAYAARLDPVYTARWSQSMLRQAARRRLLGSRPQ